MLHLWLVCCPESLVSTCLSNLPLTVLLVRNLFHRVCFVEDATQPCLRCATLRNLNLGPLQKEFCRWMSDTAALRIRCFSEAK